MSNSILKTAVVLAFTTLSALAVAADEPPGRVGRVALTQGAVSIGGNLGAEMNPAQVNWPVTSGNLVTTAPGARTELRVGSTSIRLDGDSSLEVIELDDDSIRLRLHYGSASVRVLNADVLRGFELVTPQARVRLQQPGRVRIDAERVRDTSAISVFDGVALVESGGSQLTVRAGKRAEVTDDDMRTASAVQDAFDSWSFSRDRAEDNAASKRYVTSEMTGYEDLDRYGRWQSDSEYGPLWTPTVAADWVPYRDGSWTWIDPWGWTWVDNAPWGYAPFHYGRWVYVNRHWAWAPGARAERLVWAPALVGWVGGVDWNITFRDRSRRPGFGWYPLTPHDRYVPSYHVSEDRLRWLNHHVRPDPRRPRDYRPHGLTVVPQDRFGPGGRVNVPKAPIATVPPAMSHNGKNMGIPTASAPPAPPERPHRGNVADRNGDGRPDRFDGNRADRNGDGRPDRIDGNRADRNGNGVPDRIETARVERDGFARPRPQQQPGVVLQQAPVQAQPVVSPTPHLPPAPQPVVSPTPHVSGTPQPLTTNSPVIQTPTNQGGWQRQERGGWNEGNRDRRDGRDGRANDEPRRERRDDEDRREHRQAPAPVSMAPAAPVQQAPVMVAPQPAPRPVTEARFERPQRGDSERVREAPQRVAPPPAPAAAPAPAPVARPAPPPVQASAPARASNPRVEERKRDQDSK